jgi:hypothetical protein
MHSLLVALLLFSVLFNFIGACRHTMRPDGRVFQGYIMAACSIAALTVLLEVT